MLLAISTSPGAGWDISYLGAKKNKDHVFGYYAGVESIFFGRHDFHDTDIKTKGRRAKARLPFMRCHPSRDGCYENL